MLLKIDSAWTITGDEPIPENSLTELISGGKTPKLSALTFCMNGAIDNKIESERTAIMLVLVIESLFRFRFLLGCLALLT